MNPKWWKMIVCKIYDTYNIMNFKLLQKRKKVSFFKLVINIRSRRDDIYVPISKMFTKEWIVEEIKKRRGEKKSC